MAFPLSPGINISEIDLSTVIPSLSTSTGAFAGNFSWGPVNEVVTVSDENSLKTLFGTPSEDNYVDWFTAANFLAYSNNLKLVRATNEDSSKNATANGTVGVLIQNQIDFESNHSDGANTYGAFAARCPGAKGNGLYVSICPNSNAFSANVSTLGSAFSSGWTNTNSTVINTSGDLSAHVKVGDQVALQTATITTSYSEVTNVNSSAITVSTAYSANVATGSGILRRWKYHGYFTDAPDTSDYVARMGGSNDEMHVIVIDAGAKFTSANNTILEKYAFVSKASDAKVYDGSPNYYKDVVNQRSKYLWSLSHPELANVLSWGASASGTSFKETSTDQNYYVTLGAGADGTLVDADYITAYDKFADTSTVDISLMMAGSSSSAVQQSVISNIVEVRKDCVFFVSPLMDSVVNNPGLEVDDVLTDRQSLTTGSSFVVMDSGWKYQYDKYNGKYRWLPLNADVAGTCARTDYDRDPWFSPAGISRGQIKNVIKLSWNPTAGQRDSLYLQGVNPVVTFPGEGTILYGDKTLQSRPSAFDRINVRRLFIVLEKIISKAARSTLFEFNDTFTRAQFVNLVEPFLRDVQGRRGITDFRVVCDDSNNTPEIIDRNEFVGDIYIKPARSVNFIQLNFIAVRTDVIFDEIVGQY